MVDEFNSPRESQERRNRRPGENTIRLSLIRVEERRKSKIVRPSSRKRSNQGQMREAEGQKMNDVARQYLKRPRKQRDQIQRRDPDHVPQQGQ
jgi:hypothetical protein